MKEIAKLSLKLFIITAVASLALAFTNAITSKTIEERTALDNQEARKEVIPKSDNFEEVDEKELLGILEELNINPEMVDEVYKDIVEGKVYGYTFKVLPKGYGGVIDLLVGISTEGEITGLEIVNHSETPGLGSNIEGEFKDSFKGKSATDKLNLAKGEAAGGNEIQAISGATISSQAVVDGVNIAIDIFNKINE